jgi:flavin-dependent dehydrogenase
MKNIKIIGGGIAGLTAAIHLKKAGLDVHVHERKHYCGKHTNDFQFLENWTFENDALDILRSMSIRTDFFINPWHSQEFISPSGKKYVGTSNKPLMYLIKRGRQPGSLDCTLEKQAIRNQVNIHYNSELNIEEADIVAIGINKPAVIATGIKFSFNHPNRSILILDDDLSYKMYSYFIVNENIAEIVSTNPVGRKDHTERLNLTIKRFEEVLGIKVEPDAKRFAASGSLYFIQPAKLDNQYFIGEAAGFQDCLAGFGMMYAFKSGYFAARSIIEDCDYDKLWQKDFLKPMNISVENRQIFEKLSNTGYEALVDVLNTENIFVRKLLGSNNLRQILKKIYNYSILKLLHPVLLPYKHSPLHSS